MRGGVGGLFDWDELRYNEDTSSAAVGASLFGDETLTDREEVDPRRSDGELIGVDVEELDESFAESSSLIGLP